MGCRVAAGPARGTEGLAGAWGRRGGSEPESQCGYQNKDDSFPGVTNKHSSAAQYCRPWGGRPRACLRSPPPPPPSTQATPPPRTAPTGEQPRVPTRNEHTLTRPFLIPGQPQNTAIWQHDARLLTRCKHNLKALFGHNFRPQPHHCDTSSTPTHKYQHLRHSNTAYKSWNYSISGIRQIDRSRARGCRMLPEIPNIPNWRSSQAVNFLLNSLCLRLCLTGSGVTCKNKLQDMDASRGIPETA